MAVLRIFLYVLLLQAVKGGVWLLGHVPADWETFNINAILTLNAKNVDACLAACRIQRVPCAVFDKVSYKCLCLQWTEEFSTALFDNFPNLNDDRITDNSNSSLYLINGPDIAVSIDHDGYEAYLSQAITVTATTTFSKWNDDMAIFPFLLLRFYWSSSDNTSFKNVNQPSSSTWHSSVWVKVLDTPGSLKIGVEVSTGYENVSVETKLHVKSQLPLELAEDDEDLVDVSSIKIHTCTVLENEATLITTAYSEEEQTEIVPTTLLGHQELRNASPLVTILVAQDSTSAYQDDAFTSTFVEHLGEWYNTICASISGGHQLQQPSLPEAHSGAATEDNKQYPIFKCDFTLSMQADSAQLAPLTIAFLTQMDRFIAMHLLKNAAFCLSGDSNWKTLGSADGLFSEHKLLNELCGYWNASYSDLWWKCDTKHEDHLLLNGSLFCMDNKKIEFHCAGDSVMLLPQLKQLENIIGSLEMTQWPIHPRLSFPLHF